MLPSFIFFILDEDKILICLELLLKQVPTSTFHKYFGQLHMQLVLERFSLPLVWRRFGWEEKEQWDPAQGHRDLPGGGQPAWRPHRPGEAEPEAEVRQTAVSRWDRRRIISVASSVLLSEKVWRLCVLLEEFSYMEGNLSFLPNFRQFLWLGQPERGIFHNYKDTDIIFAAYLLPAYFKDEPNGILWGWINCLRNHS